jgi:hypothetical protein
LLCCLMKTGSDEFSMNSVPFRALSFANFGEFLFHALW